MKNAALILKTIYDNLPMILTIIAIVAGIGIKVRNFLKQSKEDQKKQLQEQADKSRGTGKRKPSVYRIKGRKGMGKRHRNNQEVMGVGTTSGTTAEVDGIHIRRTDRQRHGR